MQTPAVDRCAAPLEALDGLVEKAVHSRRHIILKNPLRVGMHDHLAVGRVEIEVAVLADAGTDDPPQHVVPGQIETAKQYACQLAGGVAHRRGETEDRRMAFLAGKKGRRDIRRTGGDGLAEILAKGKILSAPAGQKRRFGNQFATGGEEKNAMVEDGGNALIAAVEKGLRPVWMLKQFGRNAGSDGNEDLLRPGDLEIEVIGHPGDQGELLPRNGFLEAVLEIFQEAEAADQQNARHQQKDRCTHFGFQAETQGHRQVLLSTLHAKGAPQRSSRRPASAFSPSRSLRSSSPCHKKSPPSFRRRASSQGENILLRQPGDPATLARGERRTRGFASPDLSGFAIIGRGRIVLSRGSDNRKTTIESNTFISCSGITFLPLKKRGEALSLPFIQGLPHKLPFMTRHYFLASAEGTAPVKAPQTKRLLQQGQTAQAALRLDPQPGVALDLP